MHWNFNQNAKAIHSQKCIWKYCLRNGGHFDELILYLTMRHIHWFNIHEDCLTNVATYRVFITNCGDESVYQDSTARSVTSLYIASSIYVTKGWNLKSIHMVMSSNGVIFRFTGPLSGKITGHRWIPPHKGQRRGALMLSLICAWIGGWVNNRQSGGLWRHRGHYDVTVMNRGNYRLRDLE